MVSFWHPTLLLFLAVATLPVLMFSRRQAFVDIDGGYRAIFWGAVIVTLAAFADYAEEVTVAGDPLWQYVATSRLDGTILPFIYAPGVLLLSFGVVRWFPAVYRVSTEIERRMAAEQELKDLLEETHTLARRAEEANQSKSEFLATMGHELRTPLNAIIGFSKLLQEEDHHPKETRHEYLGIVRDSGQHLLSIINDILDMSKLENGRLTTAAQAFRLDEVVQESIAYVSQKADGNGLYIAQGGKVGDFVSDRRVVKQIILNLLSNAVKFTESGGRIDVHCYRVDDKAVVEISDTGIGMDEEELMAAMRPFMQVEGGLSRAQEGTGLGLTLVDRFVKLLDGTLSIQSVKGKGTKVTVTLPCLSAETDEQRNVSLRLIV